MTDERFAQARLAAGVLFKRDDGAVLLVKPTYKDGWDLPGGYVQPGESPLAAARREVQEELGVKWTGGPLLAADWAPSDVDGDKILFIFAGMAAPSVIDLELDTAEISNAEYTKVSQIESRLNGRLLPRVRAAYGQTNCGIYLEFGLEVNS